MKTSCLLIVSLVGSGLSAFAQSDLVWNAGCPNNASYCRATVSALADGSVPNVIGVFNGTLYGSVPSSAPNPCPGDSTQTSAATNCFYSATSFNPEKWTYLGQNALKDSNGVSDPQTPLEVIFPSGSCSGYKYIYTRGAHILKAPTDPNNPNNPANWSFQDIIGNLTGVPSDTNAKTGSFAFTVLASGQTRLFYGNYNGHTSNPSHAYIWHSDDCGNTWSVDEIVSLKPGMFDCSQYSNCFHGREIHAIEVDPLNPSNVYVNVDTEDADDQVRGLWRSISWGDAGTFGLIGNSMMSPLPLTVGDDFVIPSSGDSIFMEADGPGAGTASICNPPPGSPPDPCGPLLSWNPGNGGVNQVAASWPQLASPCTGSPCPELQWNTAYYGAWSIRLTSEQNIFLVSTPFVDSSAGNYTGQAGLWYFLPPSYDTPISLEGWVLAIESISANNGIASVTTFEPFNIQPGDAIVIAQVSSQGNPSPFNMLLTPDMRTVTGTNTFTYLCQACPPSGTGGVAYKNGLNFFARTVEATDAATGTSYLFTGNQRMVKPQDSGSVTAVMAAMNGFLLN